MVSYINDVAVVVVAAVAVVENIVETNRIVVEDLCGLENNVVVEINNLVDVAVVAATFVGKTRVVVGR